MPSFMPKNHDPLHLVGGCDNPISTVELWSRRKNGEKFPLWLTITTVQGVNDALTNYVATLTDITHQKEASDQIEQLAFYDPLTNLPNRRLLKDRLHLALANSTRS
jgi:predicted signal transduction protein with EAL and GGDEF domain